MVVSKTAPGADERRRFLAHALQGLGAGLSLALLPGHEVASAPRLGRNPFTLGVASGDPTPDGIVLWTRLAPDPLDPLSLGKLPMPVMWRVASNAAMSKVVASGVAIAWDTLAHSVHVELNGLLPGRDYFYQFSLGKEESRIGHFRTAPSKHEMPSRLKLAVASCQKWQQGYFTAYRDMVKSDLDLILHLGDYTYESGIHEVWREGVAMPEGFESRATSLRKYRLRHTLYKLDPDLQAAHAAVPFSVIWDDHEVVNNYAGLTPEDGVRSSDFNRRRADAYQAWYEHMPVRLTSSAWPLSNLRIYRSLEFGRLATINLLDGRQYRSRNPCAGDDSKRCAASKTGPYTMLGTTQERWLESRFRQSTSRWNLIAQPVMVAQLEQATNGPDWYRNDLWDGYPLARQRLLGDIVDSGVRNPVVLTGDYHSTFVNDLKLDFRNERSASIASEFVSPSLSSGGDTETNGPKYAPMVPYNPHVKYFDGDRRGYWRATLEPGEMRMDLRFLTSVQKRNGRAYTQASWTVQDGVPWALAS